MLPNTERIPVGTLKKIAAYVKSGGSAIAVGHLPTLTPEGKPLGDAGADTSEIILVPDEASLAPGACITRPSRTSRSAATDDATVTHLGFIRRKLANADIYLVVNTSNQPIDTSATFATSHKFAAEWDGNTAASFSLPRQRRSPSNWLPTARASSSSAIRRLPPSPRPPPEKQLADLSNDWKVNFTGLNKSVDEATPTDWARRSHDGSTTPARPYTRGASRSPPDPPGGSSSTLRRQCRRQSPPRGASEASRSADCEARARFCQRKVGGSALASRLPARYYKLLKPA